METVNDELEFNTIEEVLEFNTKEHAFRNGWKKTYTLAEQYLADVQQTHLDILNHVNADMKKDFACINGPDWKIRFDESCILMSMMADIKSI